MLRPIAFAAAMLLASGACAQEGQFESALVTLRAITPAAAPAPEGDGFCEERFGAWMETRVTSMWKTASSGSEIAAVVIRDVATDLTTKTGPGSWMGFPKAAGLEEIDRIILRIDEDGQGGTVELLLTGDGTWNCVASNR